MAVSLLSLLLAAAAPGSYVREEDHRVASVTHRLVTAGRALCTSLQPQAGLLLQHLAQYSPRDREEANRQYRLSEGPGILSVVANGPAARAGFRAGDTLRLINGKAFPAPKDAAAERDEKKRRQMMEQADLLLDAELRRGPASVALLRDGKPLELLLTPEPGCASKGRLARSGQPNAFADGRFAVITTKMLGYIQSEDELAVVVAHELAHNILGHPAQLDEQGVPKGLLRNFGNNAARVHATEIEADRLGLQLVWAAGYDVSAAKPFWRRLYARLDPIPTPKLFRTHPSLGAREQLIEETVAKLKASGSKFGPERPELREGALRER